MNRAVVIVALSLLATPALAAQYWGNNPNTPAEWVDYCTRSPTFGERFACNNNPAACQVLMEDKRQRCQWAIEAIKAGAFRK